MTGWEEGEWPTGPEEHEAAVRSGAIPSPESPPLLAFLDESYQSDHYYIGGLTLWPQQLAIMEARIREFMTVTVPFQGFPPPPEGAEIHAHRIMQGRDEWECLASKKYVATRLWICRSILSIARDSGAMFFIEGLDVPGQHLRYKYPEPPHLVTLRHTLERLEAHGKVSKACHVKVIADHIRERGVYDAAIRAYRSNGTPGYRSSKLESIHPTIVWADSRASVALQVADMVAYFARRHLESHRVSDRKARAGARRVFGEIEPSISKHCRPGFKWWPNGPRQSSGPP